MIKRTLIRSAQIVVIAAIILAVGIAGTIAFTPVPKSAPLVDHAGMILDADMQARLIEMVFDAARADDALTVSEFLSEGFSPNVRNPRGDTLLIVAAYYDSSTVVKALIQHHAIELDAVNRMGLTAVAAAAFKGFETPLKLLIDAGADVNASNAAQQTAIMFASLAGKTTTVRMLIDAGADQHRADERGHTAATLAQTQGAREVLETLNQPSR